jgi:hypothetical protein
MKGPSSLAADDGVCPGQLEGREGGATGYNGPLVIEAGMKRDELGGMPLRTRFLLGGRPESRRVDNAGALWRPLTIPNSPSLSFPKPSRLAALPDPSSLDTIKRPPFAPKMAKVASPPDPPSLFSLSFPMGFVLDVQSG